MCTFKTANRSNGNLRLTGPYLEFIRENFSVVTGLNKDRHCQEKKTGIRRRRSKAYNELMDSY
jgi:hypothetical protein